MLFQLISVTKWVSLYSYVHSDKRNLGHPPTQCNEDLKGLSNPALQIFRKWVTQILENEDVNPVYIWNPKYVTPVSVDVYDASHLHYIDVIINAMASQIFGVSIVCSTVCSDADQRKHQSSASLVFVKGIHRWPVDFPHKQAVTRRLMTFSWAGPILSTILVMFSLKFRWLITL